MKKIGFLKPQNISAGWRADNETHRRQHLALAMAYSFHYPKTKKKLYNFITNPQGSASLHFRFLL
jgi:hypothetical protein